MGKVAILGPLGTFTHQAAASYFGDQVELQPFESITATFEALLNQPEISHAVLPTENSSFGPVTATKDFLSENGTAVQTIDHTVVPIQHSLMRSPAAASDSLIQVLVSHEQALGQCTKYLDVNYPQTPRQPSDSTASAAEYAQQHPEAAAICSQLAGRLFNLAVVDSGLDGKGIQDAGLTNRTTFGIFIRHGQSNTDVSR